MAIDEKNLPRLREYLATRNFTDKFFQTAQLVNKFDTVTDIKQNLPVLKILYEDLLYEYPFNHTYWIKYANFYVRIQQFDSATQVYDEAVSMNPTSPELWTAYITLAIQHFGSDIDKVIEVYERAVKSIKYDVNSHVIWDSYLNFLEAQDLQRAHSLYWRLLNYPMPSPTQIYQRYERFLNGLDNLLYQTFIDQRSDLPFPPDAATNKIATHQAYAQKIKESAVANTPADSEKKLHDILEKTEFDGEEFDAAKDKLLEEYLNKQEKVLVFEKVVYLFRKCLIVKCKYGDYWTRLLHLLEGDQANPGIVEDTFKRYAKHLGVIENKEQVWFFQADLLERDRHIEACREVYKGLEQKKVFEAYLRHLYMEIRTNNVQNVIDIFVALSQTVQDADQIAFVVQEMGDIFNKLGEVDKAGDIIKQFHDKKTEYSKFFYISWINFLKHCMKPWEEIEGVFRLAFEKVKEAIDREKLWKVYVYTARSYCNDINILREVERRYALKEEPNQAVENGLNAKRRFEDLPPANNEDEDETRKQVKTA